MSFSVGLGVPQPAYLAVSPTPVFNFNKLGRTILTTTSSGTYGGKIAKSAAQYETPVPVPVPSQFQPLVDLLRDSADNESVKQAKAVHGFVLKSDFSDRDLQALLNHVAHAYSKCSDYCAGRRVFDKTELLDAIVSMMFESQKDGDDSHEFLLLSSCLDSIVHAEHKIILEEMRTDYFFAHSTGKEETFNEGSDSSDRQSVTNEEELDNAGDGINGVGSLEGYENEDIELDTPISFIHGLDLRNLLGSLDKNVKKYSDSGSRVAIATRFQRNFMQLLYDAQFEFQDESIIVTNSLF